VALDGVVLENAHAEDRTKDVLDICAGRSDDEAVETSDRSGLLEVIVALPIGERGVRGLIGGGRA
jgi:hypothetical protein